MLGRAITLHERHPRISGYLKERAESGFRKRRSPREKETNFPTTKLEEGAVGRGTWLLIKRNRGQEEETSSNIARSTGNPRDASDAAALVLRQVSSAHQEGSVHHTARGAAIK